MNFIAVYNSESKQGNPISLLVKNKALIFAHRTIAGEA